MGGKNAVPFQACLTQSKVVSELLLEVHAESGRKRIGHMKKKTQRWRAGETGRKEQCHEILLVWEDVINFLKKFLICCYLPYFLIVFCSSWLWKWWRIRANVLFSGSTLNIRQGSLSITENFGKHCRAHSAITHGTSQKAILLPWTESSL